MSPVITFILTVLASGWAAGYILGKDLKGKAAPSPKGILASLAAVAMPTLMAFLLSSSQERANLLAQFHPDLHTSYLLLAFLIPLIMSGTGHIFGVLATKGKIGWLPSEKGLKTGAAMIPIAIIWGLLEEIGWRGYLTPKVAESFSPLFASLLVGLLWGIWHAPQVVFNEQVQKNYEGRVYEGALLWTLACMGLSGALGWLQFRTGSFLFPTLAHALVNLFGNISDVSLGEFRRARFAGMTGVPAVIATGILATALFLAVG